MNVDCFLDTNILVYAAAGREGEEGKRLRALDLVATREFGLSAQVLQEFFVTVTGKIAVPLPPREALEWIEQLEAFPCLPVDRSLVKIAVEVSQIHRVSYWDAAVIAAAEALGARILYTEDLNHGQSFGVVRAVNPFREV
jgi:predicted nucleic acid-binding protein